MKRVRLVIVDDALFIREGLTRLLDHNDQIEVVGRAATGEELLARLDEWQPDVVTLDLNMPGMGGLETLDRLMVIRPMPVIILSTHSGEGAPVTVEALSRGAVDFIDKEAYSLIDFEALRNVLVEKILHVGGAKAVAAEGDASEPAAQRVFVADVDRAYDLIVIGASTGGPRAIEGVLRGLGPSLRVPIVIVQHMPAGFTKAFAERLDRTLPLRVSEGHNDVVLESGQVIIAPAGKHVRIAARGGALRIRLDRDAAGQRHVPSVDVLFHSAARAVGARTIAVLLTGMGADGADGMAALHEAGAHTIAQDEATSIVYGMPRAAVMRRAAVDVVPLEDIGPRLGDLLAVPEAARA